MAHTSLLLPSPDSVPPANCSGVCVMAETRCRVPCAARLRALRFVNSCAPLPQGPILAAIARGRLQGESCSTDKQRGPTLARRQAHASLGHDKVRRLLRRAESCGTSLQIPRAAAEWTCQEISPG